MTPNEDDFEARQESSRGLTKSQINRLGDRLRKGKASDDHLRLLDLYRLSFGPASETVVDAIRSQLRLQPSVRTSKTRTSIIDKLRREKTRLSQMQDIAGCRIVVNDIRRQDDVVMRLGSVFDNTYIDDRRDRPSHGYRAVHVIVEILGRSVEIQVRTALQDWWAQLSEKYSDLIDPAIKYGSGDAQALESLRIAAEEITKVEDDERLLDQIRAEVARRGEKAEDIGYELLKTEASIARRRKNVMKLIAGMADIVPED